MSIVLYIALLIAVGIGRLIELGLSQRHQRVLASRGLQKMPEPHYRWMVLLHTGVLISAAVEVWVLQRPLIPALAIGAGSMLVLSNILRWWVIRTLGEQWNVQVMNSTTTLGVITTGPYRWIRHPNYVAVFVELLALPLIHSAWITAIVGGIAHVWVLAQRIQLEEATLATTPAYQALMAAKPRFLPRLRRSARS